MNDKKDPRLAVLDRLVQNSIQWDALDADFIPKGNQEILDYIMSNPDLSVRADQLRIILRQKCPPVNPTRVDYYDVMARLSSEAKALNIAQLVQEVYLSIPFYKDDPDYPRKRAFYQEGIEYFLSQGLHHPAGEMYAHLAGGFYGSTKERIRSCDTALELLDQDTREYAAVRAMRDMLGYMEEQGSDEWYMYWAFGGTVFSRGESLFLSPIFPYYASNGKKRSEALCFDARILKGGRERLKALDSLELLGYDTEAMDGSMPVGASKPLPDERELLRQSDETVVCQADGRTYPCRVFTIRPTENPDVTILRDLTETHYYASGIGLIRTVLSIRDKTWAYDLCSYNIRGGDGWLPCCVGNTWHYRQEGCPDSVDQVIKREIIAQIGETYLLSGWHYAGENPIG